MKKFRRNLGICIMLLGLLTTAISGLIIVFSPGKITDDLSALIFAYGALAFIIGYTIFPTKQRGGGNE